MLSSLIQSIFYRKDKNMSFKIYFIVSHIFAKIMSWNLIEWQGTRDQQRILGITPHFLPVLSSRSSILFFLYFILELFVTSLPTSALTPSPNSRPQIILGWPKSSFGFFLNIFMEKPEFAFWATQYISIKKSICKLTICEETFLFS